MRRAYIELGRDTCTQTSPRGQPSRQQEAKQGKHYSHTMANEMAPELNEAALQKIYTERTEQQERVHLAPSSEGAKMGRERAKGDQVSAGQRGSHTSGYLMSAG